MSLEVRTSGTNTIINGITANYIKTGESSLYMEDSFTLTCSKLNRIYTGSLYAFVNSLQANKTVCLEYDYNPLHSDNDPRFCLKQQFLFKFEFKKTVSYFDILCRFVNDTDVSDRVSITLHKLCKYVF